MSIDSKDIWEETLQKAKVALKKNDDDYMTNKAGIIEKLADDLENQGMPLEQIANAIVHALKDANISKAYILEKLDKKYKRHYNKAKEQEPEQLSDNPTTIEDKKVIEVSTTGQTITEPNKELPTDNEIVEDIVQQREQRFLPPKDKAFEELAKPLIGEVKTLREKVKVLETEKENIIKVKNEVLQKAKPFTYRKDIPLVLGQDPFDQNVELNKMQAIWIAGEIRKFVVDHPNVDYFLIQKGGIGGVRINISKPDFTTQPTH